MNHKLHLLLMAQLLFSVSSVFAQQFTISGYIKDGETGEALPGASVYVTALKKGTTANTYGFYSLTLPATDSSGVVISFVGYSPQIKKVYLNQHIKLDVRLAATADTIKEVVITAEQNRNVEEPRMGVVDIPIEKIKMLPVILGETDVLKVVQLLPGVQSGNEGTTGYFVRGGNLDQNLVLLDDATVYNPNHLFGIFSTFNTRALNNVTLIKGGFPAQYGGRLSSILDLSMKEGNNRSFGVDGGIGLISSHLLAEGPIKKEKASFIISARRTYLDLIVRPLLNKGNAFKYRFYDVNAKINWQLTENDRLFFSVFIGDDDAAYKESKNFEYGVKFGNSTATMRWNHLFGQKLFSNTSLIYNTYIQDISTVQDLFFTQIYSGINDVKGQTEFQYFPNPAHSIKAGVSFTNHRFVSRGKTDVLKNNLANSINVSAIPSRYYNELAAYVNDEYTISDKLSANVGVRFPAFISKDTSYYRAEPRTTIKYSINRLSSVKAAYTIMNQFLHLVPSSTASLPTDLWIPSSEKTRPQFSEQYALGYFRNFKQEKYETSVEVYYKNMYQQVAFKEGNRLLENNDIDSGLVYGKGWSYGAEFFLKKNTGRLTGWISYTLSWTNQRFNNLNSGKSFPFRYDKRHVLSVAGVLALSKRWTLSSVFVFSTGAVYTLPVGRINAYYGGTLFEGNYYVYEGRNNYRFNPYHRLDISATYKKARKLFKQKYDSEIVIGVYNVYSRRNPYFVYLSVDPVTNEPQAKQISLLPIIPSISYNFKF